RRPLPRTPSPLLTPPPPYTPRFRSCTFPIKRLSTSAVSPLFSKARGVAPDTVSTAMLPQAPFGTEKSVICPEKEINRKHLAARADRKSRRLNASHVSLSYAVVCLNE